MSSVRIQPVSLPTFSKQVAMMSRITISLRKAGKRSEEEPLPTQKPFLFRFRSRPWGLGDRNAWWSQRTQPSLITSRVSHADLTFSRSITFTRSQATSVQGIHHSDHGRAGGTLREEDREDEEDTYELRDIKSARVLDISPSFSPAAVPPTPVPPAMKSYV